MAICWKKEGLDTFNCLTLAEDKFGNIWTGSRSHNVAVLNPKTKKAKTWKIDESALGFGSMAIISDAQKTIWIGTNQGELVYWNGKSVDDLDDENFIKIRHPLLTASDNHISFIIEWNQWLVLGACDRVLLFDLKQWYHDKTVRVRYLNPQESNFTSLTEQNAVFTDFRDQSLWFSTSDMLYQWMLPQWLELPTFKAIPTLKVTVSGKEITAGQDGKIVLSPTQNSIDIEVNYQTKDNMPRFLSTDLVLEGDTFSYSLTSTDNKFHFQNLSSGHYSLHTLICQQDGSYDIFKYPITIQKFLWQHWWFWVALSLIPIVFFYIDFKRREEIERHKKMLTQLNITTLSSQFRPHFMLNALNSLGAQFDDNPHAEKIISRIGENINLIYDFVQKRKIYVAFLKEWKLVENTIEIQKTIFIKDLIVEIEGVHHLPLEYPVPIGIIQVFVENALLHGIRHRKNPPSLLKINISEDEKHYTVEVIDNGIGRRNSAKIYDFKKNGTGINNIKSIIDIINLKIPHAISVMMEDNDPSSVKTPGTKVTIKLTKQMDYGKFEI